jgi:HPt (histidine-containing phosphotransfer) domain-containing protein
LGAGTAREIVNVFLVDQPARMQRMRGLAANGAAAGLAREAHALAGSAGTLGLQALAAGARALEASLAETASDLPARLAPLEELAATALPWLQDWARPVRTVPPK